MKFLIFLFVLIITPFAYSLEVNLDCPSEVEVDEEFTCSFSFDEDVDSYDVKFDISRDGKSVARIYDSEKNDFKSAYYYLKDFSSDRVKLKVTEEGEFDSEFKVRVGSKVDSFPFEIVVGEGNEREIEEDEEVLEEDFDEGDVGKIETKGVENKREIISLNSISLGEGEVEEEDLELVYESKEFRNQNYFPYLFSLFLLIVFSFFVWEKF